MEEDQNGRRPKWKSTKIEDDQIGRKPKWKTTKMEDDEREADLNTNNNHYITTIAHAGAHKLPGPP